MKILLVGNPNVGKSALFSRLTGTYIMSSNYSGTTVGYTRGFVKLKDQRIEIIDVPGIYGLDPTNEAEAVAVKMLDDANAIIVNVIDATNLERNLNLTLQLIKRGLPLIVALNMWDDARHRGIEINAEELAGLLGVPVIPTIGTTGEGIKQLIEHLQEVKPVPPVPPVEDDKNDRWQQIGTIVSKVQTLKHRHHTWRETLGDFSHHPLGGLLVAAVVLAATFWLIRLIGESIISYVTDPLFDVLWTPALMKLSAIMGSSGFFHDILVGQLIDGQVDYLQSFGLLSTGLYIPIGAVLPYIVAFYFALGLLEDSGYLPRLAILMDSMMHRLGLHGYAIIPVILGFGCNVPAIMATRILESKRQRFIAATLISVAVPCAALQAMIIGLVGHYGMGYVAIVYGSLFATWIIIGFILNRIMKGYSPELLLEIPPYRLPSLRVIGEKLWLRLSGFFIEALPIVLASVFVVNILYVLGIFDHIARFTAPVVGGILGLPDDSITAILVGILRKDVAMGMLVPLSLTAKQLVISSTVLAMSFPCVATFVILGRELGVQAMLKSSAIMIVAALIVGGILNMIL
ncbi:MAG TPA: ferrous iron transport protein B [Dehalococcoidia bacterium]|nr:ferrous iron transport protein B [Dehalococcoidia bacterium]